MDWTVWTEAMYAKCGPKPTWRALVVWILDEMFWRTRLITGDPQYYAAADNSGFVHRADYWKDSWGAAWKIYFGDRGRSTFPRKW